MSSKPIERARSSFGLRLNLWYGSFFVLACAGLFLLAYLLLARTIDRQEKELIRDRLEEYAAWYNSGGLAALSSRFFAARPSDQYAFFVQVIGPGNRALFVSKPQDWQDLDLQVLRQHQSGRLRGWFSLRDPEQRHSWMVAATPLRDGHVLLVGKSTTRSQALLDQFRIIFGAGLAGAVLLGFAGGAWMTSRALLPIRQLIQTVRDIMRTGRMDARVPPRETGDELDELVKLFNAMLEKNDRLIRGMREALDNVAHDLRTPLTRLRGSAEVALQNLDQPEAWREALADTLEESERLLTMLRTLMDISEAETGAMRLNLTRVDLLELTRQVLDLYQIVAEEKNITLESHVPSGLDLRADRVSLQQVLANLIDNALKYTPPGGRVSLEARREPGAVVLEVRDTGIGMAAEELPKIWQRLYRGDKSRSEKGLGLGLSLVKAVVEAHGGNVTVTSRPGQGSCFTVRLPSEPFKT